MLQLLKEEANFKVEEVYEHAFYNFLQEAKNILNVNENVNKDVLNESVQIGVRVVVDTLEEDGSLEHDFIFDEKGSFVSSNLTVYVGY